MPRQALILVVLVVAAAGAWLWLAPPRGEAPAAPAPTGQAGGEPEPAAAAPASPAGAAAAEPSRDGRAGQPVERMAVDPGASWVVEGTARRGYREPYPGARVRLLMFDGYDAEGEPLQEVRLTADADGRFRWPLPAPAGTVTLRAEGDEEGHDSLGDDELVVAGAPPPRLEVYLYPGDCTIEGVVRDTAGSAIAGAEVQTRREVVATDASGRYRLASSSARDEEMVWARASGYAQSRATAKVGGPGSVTRADFELSPSLRVVGRVVDEAGVPVAGARVQSFFTHGNVAETDAGGRFVLDHLDPRRPHQSVYARKDGYVEARADVEPAGAEVAVGDLVLRRGVRVEGRVLDDAGHALAGVEIYIGFSPAAYNRLDAVSRDDGTFAFPHVPHGQQTMVATHAGFAPDTRTLQLGEDETVRTGLLIQLGRGHFIGGVARDEAGEPMAGASLSARHRGEYIDRGTKTDAEGRFRLEGLPADDVDLEFYGTGIVRKNVPVEALDRDDLEVVLQAAGRVAGRVVDGRTGEPIGEFTIRFVRAEALPGEPLMGSYAATWAREGRRFSGTDGYWDSGRENLVPGAAVGIEARAEGYAPGRLPRLVAAAEPDPDAHVIALHRGSRVTGRVVDARGMPVASAFVAVRPAASRERYLSHEPYESGVTQTAGDGTFALGPVAPGESILLVQVPERPLLVHGPFAVPAQGAVDRLVQLPEGAELAGRLLDAGGAPLGGATVVLHASEVEGSAHFTKTATTAVDGAFRFGGLPDGLYQISHREADGEQSVYALTVFARVRGGRSDAVVLRPDGDCRVAGTIRRQDGGAVPDCLPVSCQAQLDPSAPRDAAPPGRGALARNGRFELRGLRPGSYLIAVYSMGATGWFGSVQVDLVAGEQRVAIDLAERRPGR